jgi:hypothetical protein
MNFISLETTWRYIFYFPALSNNNMEEAQNCEAEVTLAVHASGIWSYASIYVKNIRILFV